MDSHLLAVSGVKRWKSVNQDESNTAEVHSTEIDALRRVQQKKGESIWKPPDTLVSSSYLEPKQDLSNL
jgi:hypothetical protein